ncbi:MAG: thioredoxin [Clostridia bacterium]|jgi:thioredoxin 1|nr:thioredoxin [Clostridia bacterium]
MSEEVLNLSNFDEKVKETDKLVLVDFFATWCGPCKMLAPIVSEISSEYADGMKVYKINVDENQQLAIKYGIVSIPTLVFFKNGEVVSTNVGFCSKSELDNIINKLL